MPHQYLSHLGFKYAQILALRERAAAGEGIAPREELAALAAQFPGALRELDELPLETVRERIAALEHAAQGSPEQAPRWMVAMARFHVLMRAALLAKRWLEARHPRGAARSGGAAAAEALDAALAEAIACGELGGEAALWSGHLPALVRPSRGRLSESVFERVGVEMKCTPREARGLVFGTKAR